MNRPAIISLLLVIATMILSCTRQKQDFNGSVPSPDGRIQVQFILKKGVPYYMVFFRDDIVIDSSSMGFIFRDNDSLLSSLVVTDHSTSTFHGKWKPVWGKADTIEDHFNELKVDLKSKGTSPHEFRICFRAYDDGVAFRYIFPGGSGSDSVFIADEKTEFNVAEKGTAWWIPADFESYEHLYRTTAIEAIDGANTPVTFKLTSGLHLAIHEADLTRYAGMTLKRTEGREFISALVPWPDGDKVKTTFPFQTPWRTILISEDAGGLLASGMILNLNEPCVLEDVSWIRPMKYIGIWWGMHLGIHTWYEGPRHGATTERAMQYIDFAAENNIGGVLVEGWNTGWESRYKGDRFDFVTPYPDFDLTKVAAYAKEKGVELIGHHETGGQALLYEKHLDSAFSLYQKLGIRTVKTGYAGNIRPEGYHHHGQWMVEHYRKVLEKAAAYNIMIDAHEPIKATGISRTYPNMMTREGVRGMEWNAWSDGNLPEHTAIIPFTRMLAGPVDYTPGIFDIMCRNFAAEREKWNSADIGKTRVHTTLAKQLALYVVLFSPLQMAADLIENYQNQPAFEFIREVPVTWDETRVLNASVGDYVSIVRKKGDNWYVGAITDEKARTFTFSLDFLEPGYSYSIEKYEDGAKADWETRPLDLSITSETVKNTDSLFVRLAAGGGFAAIISKEPETISLKQ